MSAPQRRPETFPVRLKSPSGLNILVNANGSIRRMEHRGILLNLFPGTEIEGGPANLYLRRSGGAVQAIPLLGPGSPAAFSFQGGCVCAAGQWGALRFHIRLVLARSAPAWFWHVQLENTGAAAETLDLVHVQDLGLAPYAAVRINELYVSQYVDHTPLDHPQRGWVLASRQNQPVAGRHPWTLIGALGGGGAYATDALQFFGPAARAGRAPQGLLEGLPAARLQHEHSLAAIQDRTLHLPPGGSIERGFFGWFEPDHPAASGPSDLAFADRALLLPEAAPVPASDSAGGRRPAATLFAPPRLLESLDLTQAETEELFGPGRTHEEREGGRPLSFFAGPQRHVVFREKELAVLRPHAHIMRTGQGWVPDEASLTSTPWMAGVFHAMLTQGHVSSNRFLSTVHGYLGLFRADGLRVFVDEGGAWRLLDVPSAFEMTPGGCRWIYKHAHGTIEVRSAALAERHALTLRVRFLSGAAARLLVACHVAVNGDDGSQALPFSLLRDADGILVHPRPASEMARRFPGGRFRIAPLSGTVVAQIGGDEMLFVDGVSRSQPWLCLLTPAAREAGFELTGALVAQTAGIAASRSGAEAPAALRIHAPAEAPQAALAARFEAILPWFIHNARLHYLAPRGIEQYTGGGWGTRDICQGPVEMLLALGRFEAVRDLLVRVFKAQNPDGDWPQWFMFFDRDRAVRAGDSHGDIVFWPLLALSRYLIAAQDSTMLSETLPFFHPRGETAGGAASVRQHVEHALDLIRKRIVPGTRLPAYGHGDWNDSLQPVDRAMRNRLCSSWTATLHYQTLVCLAEALHRMGEEEAAARLAAEGEGVAEDFRRMLIKDGILAGFASFPANGEIEYLLHPADRTTGLSYRLLPMVHAVINDLLTPDEAERHLALIAQHLLGPDGARLFDRPMAYRGGEMRIFQRAESAAFFGREIGLMYTHAHLRYAEALARHGNAQGLLLALAQANPVGLRAIVPQAALRQANCYYSSSDAAFADRYQALGEYERVRKGQVPLEGGWRIYSSGAGIWIRLLLQCFLGLQQQKSALLIDPVIPPTLDGLRVETELGDAPFEVTYRIRSAGCGPQAILLNGREAPFTRSANPYRTAGAQVAMKTFRAMLADGRNRLEVHLA